MKKINKIHPVLRAVIAQQWEQTAVAAQIQAIIGGDASRISNQAGRVVFVIMGASLLDGVDANNEYFLRVQESAGALYALAGAPSVEDDIRCALIDGLEACGSLCEVLTRKSMTDAAVDLHFALQVGNLNWQAFETMGVAA